MLRFGSRRKAYINFEGIKKEKEKGFIYLTKSRSHIRKILCVSFDQHVHSFLSKLFIKFYSNKTLFAFETKGFIIQNCSVAPRANDCLTM